MGTLTNVDGSSPSTAASRDEKEQRKLCVQMVEIFDTLTKDKNDAKELVKIRDRELEEQSKLVTFFQSERAKLLQENMRMEIQIKTLELTTDSQQTEIMTLKDKLKNNEDERENSRKENGKSEPYKELLAKHNKLREFVKTQLSVSQKLTKTLQTSPDVHQHTATNHKLTRLTVKFTKHFKKLESSRQRLLRRAQANHKWAILLTKMLQISSNVVKLQCRYCSKSFPSWKNYNTHQRVVHTVQKSWKFLQQQSIAGRKKIHTLLKRKYSLQNKISTTKHRLTSKVRKKLVHKNGNVVEHKNSGSTKILVNLDDIHPPQSGDQTNYAPASLLNTSGPGCCPILAAALTTRNTISEHAMEYEYSQQIVTEAYLSPIPSISIPNMTNNDQNSPQSSRNFKASQQQPSDQFSKRYIPKSQQEPLDLQLQCTANTEEISKPPELPFSVTTQKHDVDHSKRFGFRCQCGSSYSDAQALERHIRYFAVERKFVCPKCSKRFVYLSRLNDHLKTSHKKKNFRSNFRCGCSQCGTQFANLSELYQHRHQFHSSKIAKMPEPIQQPNISNDSPVEASEIVVTYSSVQHTLVIESSVPTIQIKQVWKAIEEHAFSHAEDQGTYNCKCGLRFGSMDTLEAHTRFFALKKHFPCSHCKVLFTGFGIANAHMRKLHQDTQLKSCVGCKSCGVIFADKKEYGKHLVGVKKGRCGSNFCSIKLLSMRPAEYNEISNVKRTRAITTIGTNHEPKFVCRFCSKRFLYASTLRTHKLTAHKIVENQGIGCHGCGEFFPDHLKLHQHHRMVHNSAAELDTELKHNPLETNRMHAEVPASLIDKNAGFKYKCRCSKLFISKTGIKFHIRASEVGKIFVCPWCPGGTVRHSNYSNLKNHIRKLHPEAAGNMDKFGCGFCGKTFQDYPKLKQHCLIEHGS